MLAVGKSSYWVPGHKDEALKVYMSVGEMGVTQKPGEGAQRALQRKHPVLPLGTVAGRVAQRRDG